jgi:hypothetical protein
MIPNNGVDMAEFLTMDDGQSSITHYNEVKDRINHLRDACQQTDEPIQAFKYAFLARWILLTNNFIHWYATSLVPHDRCYGIHDVRCDIGIHTLPWPTILLLNLDGTIAKNDEVDHLGRGQLVLL